MQVQRIATEGALELVDFIKHYEAWRLRFLLLELVSMAAVALPLSKRRVSFVALLAACDFPSKDAMMVRAVDHVPL